MPPLAKSSRRIVVRAIAGIVAILAALAAAIAGILAPYFTSRKSQSWRFLLS